MEEELSPERDGNWNTGLTSSLAQQKRNLIFNMVKVFVLVERDPGLEWSIQGKVRHELPYREGVQGTLTRNGEAVSGERLVMECELTTRQVLAAAVLAEDDVVAASALADLLQQEGVDAVKAAYSEGVREATAVFRSFSNSQLDVPERRQFDGVAFVLSQGYSSEAVDAAKKLVAAMPKPRETWGPFGATEEVAG